MFLELGVIATVIAFIVCERAMYRYVDLTLVTLTLLDLLWLVQAAVVSLRQ